MILWNKERKYIETFFMMFGNKLLPFSEQLPGSTLSNRARLVEMKPISYYPT